MHIPVGKQETRAARRPLVSVVLPTHNRVVLLARAVTSVLEQSEQDFELIVIDDASEDGTGEYLAALASQDDRVQVLRNAAPRGGAGARNQGMALSRGRWIAFLDDDDQWKRTKLQQQLRTLRADVHAVACSCSYLVRHRSGWSRTIRVPENVTLPQLLTKNWLRGAWMCV